MFYQFISTVNDVVYSKFFGSMVIKNYLTSENGNTYFNEIIEQKCTDRFTLLSIYVYFCDKYNLKINIG